MDSGTAAEELWRQVHELISASRGWSLRPLRLLGRPHDVRWTWLAQGEPGLVIVKANANPFVAERMAWAPRALDALATRGYPVPTVLWHGRLGTWWSVVVLNRLPGRPLRTLDERNLDALLSLVELQADLDVGPGGWDTTEWIELVLFEGWEGWWDAAERAAPETSRRLRAFVEGVRGYRLPRSDVVHGDLNVSNMLASNGQVTGVIDWDALGYGSRASDLAGLIFDWHRFRLAGDDIATEGETRIVNRIVELVGEAGLRCSIGYGAVGRLGLAAQRGTRDDLERWCRVTDAILDSQQMAGGCRQ